jgi:MraZ protein
LSFLGQYEHNLDAKDRLTVPSRFRAALADGVVLAKGLEPSVWVFAPPGYERFTQQFLGQTNPLGRRGRMMRRHFHGGAFDDSLDSAGRIRLPKKLIEHAGLGEGRCVIVGSDDWFEIWNAERWADYEKEMDAEVSDVAENLSEDERGG